MKGYHPCPNYLVLRNTSELMRIYRVRTAMVIQRLEDGPVLQHPIDCAIVEIDEILADLIKRIESLESRPQQPDNAEGAA